MARSVRLRSWQKLALDAFLEAGRNGRSDFLAVATPGAGKTTFALTAARHHLAEHPHARVIIVVPTQHLKAQWAGAAEAFDLHLEPRWSARGGRLPADMHGIVTTYQQVATSAPILAGLAHDAFVVFDEIHHAADERAWGEAVRLGFAGAGRRLGLSGTPFRSDTRSIPFIRYVGDEAEPDFEYGYGDALADGGVVRPVHFPRIDGHMEWAAPDGSLHAAGFEDELDATRSGQRLRTALSLDGQWLPTVLAQADAKLREIRRTHADAAGLVIATDQDHARGITGILDKRLGVQATVATSDDPLASTRIADFADGSAPWLVAVRMVSEGVDLPRLRVAVFATTTTTDLFFRQAVGRVVRHVRGIGPQRAWFFIPDDARLRVKAWGIAEQRRHVLRRKVATDDDTPGFVPGTGDTAFDDVGASGPADQVQPSLFTPISSVALPGPTEASVGGADVGHLAGADRAHDESVGHEIELAPAPRLSRLEGGGDGAGEGGRTRAQQKAWLRAANSERVQELVRLTGDGHAAINAELNRRAGIRKVTEATSIQLDRRLRNADHWLARLTNARRSS